MPKSPCRDLIPEETEALLIQEQVDALPENTVICVKWHNENGPWAYRTEKSDGGVSPAKTYIPFMVAPLDNVGKEPGQQRVFLPRPGVDYPGLDEALQDLGLRSGHDC
jgi:hypothetical protein